MGSGFDIIIVGVCNYDENFRSGQDAGNLEYIGPRSKLEELFSPANEPDRDKVLIKNPMTCEPKICYFGGECGYGSVGGVALGYIIYRGYSNTEPQKVDLNIFSRVRELLAQFPTDLQKAGLKVDPKTLEENLGVWSLNVYDT